MSDQVNELDLVTFFDATLAALEDGREMRLDEVEVERRELHVIEVTGRRGDPGRRLRTFQDAVVLQVGPYRITGCLHRPPVSPPLAALAGWNRFVPVTGAVLNVVGSDLPPVHREVMLVNRERVSGSERVDGVAVLQTTEWPPLPKAEPEPEPDAEAGTA